MNSKPSKDRKHFPSRITLFSLPFMITIEQYKVVDSHSHYLKKQLAVGYGMMTTERRLHRESTSAFKILITGYTTILYKSQLYKVSYFTAIVLSEKKLLVRQK